jgi:conjugal transfer pilus assembly protein TraB
MPQSPYPREPKALEESQVIGGIEVVSNPAPEPQPQEDKKKEELRVYLPPSFMEGSLLSGLDCPTVESAKKDPMPALIRIKDLAVLPNAVKANLKGCFVIAHGWGSLADERAHLKLVSLSCLDRGGKSVIDQEVDGFVVDSDGKIGLSGTVVAKLGSTIARAALAGFFGGVGDFLKASTTTTQVTAAGTIQSIDTNRLATAGLGGGLSTAANELGKFYMELARQTMPVIEVGATKTITIVISRGVDLVIKEKQGVKGNEEN